MNDSAARVIASDIARSIGRLLVSYLVVSPAIAVGAYLVHRAVVVRDDGYFAVVVMVAWGVVAGREHEASK